LPASISENFGCRPHIVRFLFPAHNEVAAGRSTAINKTDLKNHTITYTYD